ncbi:MAG: flagellar biosynthetic protein FliR [Bacteriovoracaceae bacterium]|nr:flagellar biosynthetic protein FliR [Bacteriovoracaceae bacterium]
MNVTIIDHANLLAFWLAFTRWLAMCMQLPVFDNVSIPVLVKVLAALVISYCFYPQVQHILVSEVNFYGHENYWFLTMFHAMVGIVVGFCVKVIMSIFLSVGALINQQVGFASLSYFDPNHSSQVGPFEQLIHWCMIIMLLSSGALLPMFKGGLGTFQTINIGNIALLTQSSQFIYEFFKSLIGVALVLVSPLMFINLLLNLVLGIVAKTVPQMNILMVSFAVNIGIGLIVFVVISEEFFYVAYETYIAKLGEWFKYFT